MLSLSPHILNCYKPEMNSAFYKVETYFSILDKMTEQHISSEVKHNFGKGRGRNLVQLTSLWPCHAANLCQ